ncbi:MAG: MMPL family transporter [Treponema sp.]|jgi:predicted RND superfamily exporter protein|nr:MMPL family transporter [Treponema sp.]
MEKLYKYPWLIIAIITIITVFFGFQLPKAELDNNNLRFVPYDDPALKTSRWIDEQFGSSFFILVGLQRETGTIFEPEFLNQINDYTNAVLDIPIVRNVTSIINADYITSYDDSIIAEKLTWDNFSGTQAEIEELKRRLLSWDMYERALYSDDFTATQILIPLTISSEEASSKEISGQFLRIRDIAYEIFTNNTTVFVTGMPIIISTVNESMHNDLALLIPVVILVILSILFFSFRGFTPVVLPLLTVVVSVIWSMGAMPLFNIRLSVISTVLPVILSAVGSAYGIHVVTHYLAGRGNKDMTKDEHTALVVEVILKIRKPVFLAALTTFVSFVSFCFTTVIPCKEFGYFASFGVAAAFIVAITLIPSLLIVRGPKKLSNRVTTKSEKTGFSSFLAENLSVIAHRKKTILFFAVLVIAFSLYGLSKLIVDNVMVEYFRPNTDIAKSDKFIREQFGGSKVISVVAHSDSTELTLHPDTLITMDNMTNHLQKTPGVGKIMGFTDLVKRINQVFNADESSDGLAVTNSANIIQDDFGFAYFGFGDFGFSDFTDTAPVKNTEPEKVYSINEIIELLESSDYKTMNANDLVWELKKRVNYEGASYYEIPANPERYGKTTPEELQRLISNYLVLLSGNISEYANDPLEPTAVKVTVQLRTLGMTDSHAIFDEIKQFAEFLPEEVRLTLGGTTMVESSINDLVVQSQIISMLFSIVCVFLIVTVSNKSIIAGLIGCVPLSISILLNFAVMGFTGIKLNLGTSMVAAVAVGVGIDYTIHCMEAFKRELKIWGENGNFLQNVFFSSGKAIIINAVSVGAGFAVLLLSGFVMLGDLGLLIALTMFSSALISLTVIPALLLLFKPKFAYGDKT